MRVFAGLVAALCLLLPAAPALAAPAPVASKTGEAPLYQARKNWDRYAPGKRAYAKGSLLATNLVKDSIPPYATVKVTGKAYDLTKGGTCGYAVFRITYLKADGSSPFKHRTVRDCTYKSAKSFTFTDKRVALVELKVCSEAKHSKPSLNCLYAQAWKVLYSTL
ncbi:hypothetical protein Aph01nite_48110 [Acrocarpospora phusangensis]|uniref:Uncharacterized protein n=1 Tax=Acrocarpospora phusangensis TaxID=1070424 RepID=A0A919QCU7_9ACTN|nr:hypothetical protein [Acrocarpospora phusangensis]GIH26501.1 hypothetical protein Aph01nite_48110 [Acrocarpospora phusangensis]